jgi:hypothetical protein
MNKMRREQAAEHNRPKHEAYLAMAMLNPSAICICIGSTPLLARILIYG